ncbi:MULTISPECIES: TIGR04282 family arsenosugar biosynthesis glycosyltransferase [Okeania]|uniref:Glycosyltransferase n=1 Tax=Okeania hirsuta TaxID=1458930 RepID=A0A3N6P8T5_9CYAN|nr:MULTISPECIES: TIGR04282 family arsenosugar biosynthesis glycosyltransferase [Okeania]NEP08202.1 glycosyltransferase [Okeania sp. SIO4D6]NEP37904.1 glycosyltransferase [Okeania sp. SIO2H7]NEP73609.1 glycosyltransferase [Okeania sp. SIO2G5]NEP97021.1 glycosyltransferase [Okeania sp. SIO2F5]NEQ90660.1 glycosyltransferase [Okeania sp. SIO2G4]
MEHQQLIIFTRYPEPGKTKTRLIPALGAEGAANLQRQMTETTVKKANKLFDFISLSVEVRFVGGDLQLMKNWLGSDLKYQEQGMGDLGERMARGFQSAFNRGMKSVVIIGIDCPSLTSEIILQAFAKLTESDVIIGPATDGGYYLIGLRKITPELFQGINWGTSEVLSKTVAIAQSLKLVIDYLPKLSDIDRPEDLEKSQFKIKGTSQF